MKIFDLHADLAEAIRPYRKNGSRSVLRSEWHERFLKGEITWTAAASFFAGEESWEVMKETVQMVKNDILSSGYSLILNKEDLCEEAEEPMFLMTVEGMCGIHEDPETKIQWLYDQGNRIGSLAWNDQNDLATGNSGDPTRGLTDMGRQVIRTMNELHMIVDVSHANEKTFWDILDESSLPVIATHSNAKSLCTVERNLTNQQMRALAAKGGLIGLNACNMFIHDEKEKQTARQLAKHARYMADLIGIEHVACGFDFGAYYADKEDYDLLAPEQAQNFILGLREEGFDEEEITAIAYGNVMRFLRQYL